MTVDGWSARTLGDLSTLITKGTTPTTNGHAYTSSGVPFLRVENITASGGLDLADVKYISDKTHEALSRSQLAPGDILFSIAGALGRTSMVPTSLPKANINQAIALIRLSDEGRSQLLPDFLKYELHGEVTKGQIRSGAAQLAQANLNLKQVGELKLLLPPLPEQRKIAAILSSVDEAIEGTEAVIDQLQVVKKAIMADLLTRGIPGRHKKFKQTEIGEVPADWEITTVGKVGEFSGGNGFRPPDWSSAGLPIIRIQNLNGSQDFNYFARKPDLDWLVEPGELLFAWAGSRGASFGPCIWPGPQGVLNQHIHRIKPFPSIRKRFFFYLLQIITQEVEKKAHGFKDTLVHLRKAELTNWPVALPPIAEQDLIVASLDSAADRLRSEEAALNGLKGTRSALMSVLLTGEVRVRLEDEAACD